MSSVSFRWETGDRTAGSRGCRGWPQCRSFGAPPLPQVGSEFCGGRLLRPVTYRSGCPGTLPSEGRKGHFTLTVDSGRKSAKIAPNGRICTIRTGRTGPPDPTNGLSGCARGIFGVTQAQKETTGRPVWDRPVVHSPWSFRSSPAEAVIGRAYSAPGISLASAKGPTAEPSSPSREPASRPAPGSGCGSSAPSALRNPCRGSRSQQRSCSQAPRRGC